MQKSHKLSYPDIILLCVPSPSIQEEAKRGDIAAFVSLLQKQSISQKRGKIPVILVVTKVDADVGEDVVSNAWDDDIIYNLLLCLFFI